ncbi:protein NRT1/ PTR FAMILY 4.3-like [Telopea speciosissima]|uniref:protein NRT1/ PTR FAMILY 4.3-like n=1 Tax=Telopea speciosissima TaxID=54955 RepID=UPI001CC6AB12|nr:protein NRT1/ PTR FAMILY 4.3-like [Telopea speciosissima]
MLALQAYFPSLRPPNCDTSKQWSNCEPLHGHKAVILYIALYIMALGNGCFRANLPPFGAEQSSENDDDDQTSNSSSSLPRWRRHKSSSYFNWLNLSTVAGNIISLIFIVWVQKNYGWAQGFALSAAVQLLGVLVLASGLLFYRNQMPRGSPLTRILQVLVAAFRKRKLGLPENEEELHQERSNENVVDEMLSHTEGFKFLDKASISIFGGSNMKWALCSMNQVEETKIVLRMLPIFISAVLAYIPIPQLLAFTIQQSNTMDTTMLGKLMKNNINVSPVTLIAVPMVMQMVFLVIYDRLFVPFARKMTGYRTGITPLQRAGVGFMVVSLGTGTAALIEKRRKRIARQYGLIMDDHQVPMSIMWLGPQYFSIMITDVFTYVGLLEFFNIEASRGMKSLGSAIFSCVLGLASFLGSVLVDVLNKATSSTGTNNIGWLGGNNLNKNYLDHFYWLLSILGLVGFFNYLYWAKSYVYKRNKLIRMEDG